MAKIYGYARVSSTGQNLDAQIETLEKNNCSFIFEEKESGKDTKGRNKLNLMLEMIEKGDTVIVTKLDRLARSMLDFHSIQAKIKNKGGKLKVLDMGIDPDTKQGQLVLGVLASVAQFERALIRERQAEGIARAKAQGKHLGRPKLTKKARGQVIELNKLNKTKKVIAEKTGLGISTIYRILKQEKEAQNV